jgi:hypothetical protein
MDDGTEKNNSFRLNGSPSVGGGNITNNVSAPDDMSRSFEQSLLDQNMSIEQPRVTQMLLEFNKKHNQQQQGGSYEGEPNGGDVLNYQGMRLQHPPTMEMNGNRASLQQHYQQTNSEQLVMPPTYANNSDNHYNFHRQSSFQPENIQMLPPRGRQEQGRQQNLTRSLPNNIPHEHDNGGLLRSSNTRPFSQSMPQFQGNPSLEALRANVHRQKMEVEHLEKQVGYSSSSAFNPTTSFFPRQQQGLMKRMPALSSKPLFHREDPLGFCRDVSMCGYGGDDSSSSKKNPSASAPPSVNWQLQQHLQHPEQTTTVPNNNLAQVSMQDAMTTALPPPSLDSSQTKRRRLNSDQMLHMFLSDVIIESPSEIAGKKMLALAPTTTFTATDDGVDSALPRPPLVNNNASMTSDQEMAMNSSPMPQGDDQATKQQVDYDSDVNKKPKQVTTDAAPNDATPRGTSSQPIITPSTATISELTAEIRSQAMMQRDQKKEERATSPSNETQDSSSETTTTPNTATGLANIASVMEASQTSQQNIHDWDKQFGLKRAHSKTMRESCRSRKKVLDFLKGEIKTRTASVLSALFTSVECPTQWESSTSAEAAADSSDVMTTEQGGELDQRSPSPSPSQSSGDSDDPDMGATEQVKDDKDDELERMFRRASLECVERIMGEGASLLQRERQTSSGSSSSSDKSVADTLMPMMPQSTEADRVEYHARCA